MHIQTLRRMKRLAGRHCAAATPAHPSKFSALRYLPPAGPNGCGKSTLIKALCGLHRLSAGSIHLQDASLHRSAGLQGTMFVPQRPLAAPGSALWQQLCYPGADGGSAASSCGTSTAIRLDRQQQAVRPPDAHLLSLLRRVGLEYLLERVGGSFEAPADWAAMLSPGELQRLTIARVLHRYAARLLCWLGERDALWPAALAARGLAAQECTC